jgi:hypothetical protein
MENYPWLSQDLNSDELKQKLMKVYFAVKNCATFLIISQAAVKERPSVSIITLEPWIQSPRYVQN